tara:strand:- start:4780 stop:5655 length:876 start_codon:yes stop_codon:yes gene_type:complete
MGITKQDIHEIRQITDAPILKCKKALEEAGGDKERAIEILREMGTATAQKKGARVACEGVVAIKMQDQQLIILEVNSETDFAAKNEFFKNFVSQVANTIMDSDVNDVQGLSDIKLETGQTLEATRQELVGKIGENIQVRRFEKMVADEGLLAFYQHGEKIGVIVKLAKGSADIGRDVAMQIAATNPSALNKDQMDPKLIAKEREIFQSQVDGLNKPENVLENIINGKLNKFINENTVLGQAFVKDPKLSVGDYLKQNDTEVESYIRFELGEGIEKKTVSFADEVEQAKGSV